MKKFMGGVLLATAIFLGSSMTAHAEEMKDVFNAEYYADSYEDLKAAFGDDEDALYNHFLKYGLKEGRCMSPVLDVVKYRATYADLEEAFGNDWDAYVNHYFEYGIKEGRNNGTGFNAEYYLNSYGDLQAAFGDDIALATAHYVEYGYEEGRICKQAATAATQVVIMPPVVYEYDDDGNVIKETYYENNKKVKEIKYGEDENDGEYTVTTTYEYHESGRLSQKVENYVCEDRYSNYTYTYTYYDNPKNTMQSEKRDTYNIGSVTEWDQNEVKRYYRSDTMDGVVMKEWYASGNKKSYSEDYSTSDGTSKSIEYYDNATNQKKYEYVDTGNTVTTTEWDEDGNMTSQTIE